jgi:uncharacterized protein (TIGR02271 family)
MNSVLVGIFDTQAAGIEARGKLVSEGFSAGAVSLTEAAATAPGSPARTRAEPPENDGAIAKFFKSIFGDDDDENVDSQTYREALRRGACGVSVTATSDEEVDKAEQILNDCGAVDIDERTEQWRGDGWAAGDAAPQQAAPLAGGDTRKVNVVEEELKVGKRAVARGGVRVHSWIEEVPVEESVKLRQEHVDVARRAVDRPATDADFQAFKEGSVDVRETSEEAVVSKNARVVGEVDISKSVTEKDRTVQDTLRKTRVDVDKIDAETATPARRP